MDFFRRANDQGIISNQLTRRRSGRGSAVPLSLDAIWRTQHEQNHSLSHSEPVMRRV